MFGVMAFGIQMFGVKTFGIQMFGVKTLEIDAREIDVMKLRDKDNKGMDKALAGLEG